MKRVVSSISGNRQGVIVLRSVVYCSHYASSAGKTTPHLIGLDSGRRTLLPATVFGYISENFRQFASPVRCFATAQEGCKFGSASLNREAACLRSFPSIAASAYTKDLPAPSSY